jgi:hypothetical protein
MALHAKPLGGEGAAGGNISNQNIGCKPSMEQGETFELFLPGTVF